MHCKCLPITDAGSAHCEVMILFLLLQSAPDFQNAHALITFRKSFAFTCPRIRLSRRIMIQNALFRVSKTHFQKPDLKQALRSHGLKSGFQIRKVLKRLSERDSSPCEHSPLFCLDVWECCGVLVCALPS